MNAETIKRYKTEIIILSILSVAGIGYFIYSRLKIHNLNNKVQDLEQFQNQLNNLPDVELNPNDTIPPDPQFFPTENFANPTSSNSGSSGSIYGGGSSSGTYNGYYGYYGNYGTN
jgi:hypothetical protein